MGEIVLYIVLGVILGFIIGWLISNFKSNNEVSKLKEESQKEFALLDKQFAEFKATFNSEIQQQKSMIIEKESKVSALENEVESTEKSLSILEKEQATFIADTKSLTKTLKEKVDVITDLQASLETKTTENKTVSSDLATKTANFTAAKNTINQQEETITNLKEELTTFKNKYNASNEELATAKAENNSLLEKLIREQKEIKEVREQFNIEFQNIASKILKDNTKSFSELNESKIKELLSPLNKDIKEFKTKVEDVYNKESQERFSLGERVKELAAKSEQISQDAINLTNALKGEAKTQGNWGEMILESILEKSGLRKDEEYFMEHQLLDADGKPLRSDSENKKMRPDAVIKYPDNRNVIIDSKVSLNAFTRYLAASDITEQKNELQSHLSAIKNHIITLSSKGYDDYDKALDFVMMFIPSEPAYIAAMQADANLWNYAYDKRILLMNPTNLITSLKLIVDLWKREYQNQNAIAIADRGAKLYDKFVGFVDNLEKVGKHIVNAQTSYDEAYKQLSTGNDNLVLQATKLKKLGVKNKKKLSKELENDAALNILTE
jgi:DNA recombination protein RmuC